MRVSFRTGQVEDVIIVLTKELVFVMAASPMSQKK